MSLFPLACWLALARNLCPLGTGVNEADKNTVMEPSGMFVLCFVGLVRYCSLFSFMFLFHLVVFFHVLWVY